MFFTISNVFLIFSTAEYLIIYVSQINVTPKEKKTQSSKVENVKQNKDFHISLAPFQPQTRISMETTINIPTECFLHIKNPGSRSLNVSTIMIEFLYSRKLDFSGCVPLFPSPSFLFLISSRALNQGVQRLGKLWKTQEMSEFNSKSENFPKFEKKKFNNFL